MSGYIIKNWIDCEKRLDWEFTKICNLRCSHCISPYYYSKISNELSDLEARRIVERCYQADIRLVHFFGGEPTARSDFLEILLLLDELGIATTFTTNGILLRHEKFISILASMKHLRGITFSFEDTREEFHDAIRGKGSFVAAYESLYNLTTEVPDIPVSIGFTLNRPAMENLHPRDIIDFFADAGADKIIFQNLAVPKDASSALKHLSYGPKIWLPFIYSLFDMKSEVSIPFLYDIKPLVADHLNRVIGSELPIDYCGCYALSTEFRMLPNGVIIPCSAAIGWPEALDSYLSQAPTLVEKPLQDILYLDIYQKFLITKKERGDPYMEPCRSCQFAFKRCNPCIFGRLEEDVHVIQNCLWVKEVENGK